jgi:hypothetical protein
MFYLILLIFIIAVGIVLLRPDLLKSGPVTASAPASDPNLYRPKALMSPVEIEFYGRLTEALPEHFIFPQVAMGAILKPKTTSDKREFHSIRGTFAQKIVDFLVCDKSMNIVAIVELDDRSHNADKDDKRDAMLKSAGYKTIRWQASNKPKIEDIAEKLKTL